MKRFWPHIFVAVGLGLMAAGFLYDVFFAGIPYQDPTSEMSASYARHARIASVIFWCGGGAFFFGAFTGVGLWVVRRQKISK